jgi:hypothetical protein
MTYTRFILGGTILLLATMSATAQVACSNASLVGQYGLSLDGSGFATSGNSGPTFQRTIGLFTADGAGLAKANVTTTLNGTVTTAAYTGNYSIQGNCTGTLNLGPSFVLSIGLGGGGQSAALAGVASNIALSGQLRTAPGACTASVLSPGYLWESDGEVVQAGVVVTALAGLANLQLDGRGGLSGAQTRVQNGSPVTASISGQYTLNADCSGTMHFTDMQAVAYNVAFVVIDGGASLLIIQTDATSVNSGIAISSSFTNTSGALAQIASAGHWTTTITLVNKGATPAPLLLNFFDQNGSPLLLPLSFPQTSVTGPPAASRLPLSLGAGATVIIQTTGPDTQPTQTGWAQLLTNGNIGGHAVYTQTEGSNSIFEAVVPIETRNPAAFVLPFDNLSGFNTGIALANTSAAQANIAVVIRDDSGSTLQLQTITLPAQGQASFVLSSRFPGTAGKRGTVEFDTPAGGQITVLGLRFNPTGAFSTVPPLAR